MPNNPIHYHAQERRTNRRWWELLVICGSWLLINNVGIFEEVCIYEANKIIIFLIILGGMSIFVFQEKDPKGWKRQCASVNT